MHGFFEPRLGPLPYLPCTQFRHSERPCTQSRKWIIWQWCHVALGPGLDSCHLASLIAWWCSGNTTHGSTWTLPRCNMATCFLLSTLFVCPRVATIGVNSIRTIGLTNSQVQTLKHIHKSTAPGSKTCAFYAQFISSQHLPLRCTHPLSP